jgi:hypothetical protein
MNILSLVSQNLDNFYKYKRNATWILIQCFSPQFSELDEALVQFVLHGCASDDGWSRRCSLEKDSPMPADGQCVSLCSSLTDRSVRGPGPGLVSTRRERSIGIHDMRGGQTGFDVDSSHATRWRGWWSGTSDSELSVFLAEDISEFSVFFYEAVHTKADIDNIVTLK